ncbi:MULTISPECIES: cell division protein SepF [unclassified Enterococcus]|uniref:cell division protein SepF n=1 Tax=unclassified Enterococcus TaxID=2608891 RepID=UPI0015546E20|nr:MULTISPECIES: cell division protein SepF [unclassified Enterococcus]MBS7577650.1 cell division protein SepF [Enterococcus sp. MMGLQ5-2]MBS7584156.1 cell division protein SepF [Enterococcus sp. MMGLQ5-1]NPD12014.1 cell division protein SepF [Enterococcus sp. MMGLQ5-1]NPD37483.1 cell division protein SepF [Enterococcus sp. MMGLQ5-2]
MSFLDKINNLSNFFGINDEVDDFEGDSPISRPKQERIRTESAPRSEQSSNFRRQVAPVQADNVVAMRRQSEEKARQETARYGNGGSASSVNDRIKPSATKAREDYLVNQEPRRRPSANAKQNQSKAAFSTEQPKKDNRPKITIKQPRVYSDAMKIAEFAMNDEAVLVNFHYMEEHQARRIIDFLTGIAHALHGDLQRVGNQIFLLTPASIQIDGNEAKSLVNNQDFDYEI